MIKRCFPRIWLVGVLMLACAESETLAGCDLLKAPYLYAGLCYEECPEGLYQDAQSYTCEEATANGCPFDAPFLVEDETAATDMCVEACPFGGFDVMKICDLDPNATDPTGSSSGDAVTTGDVGSTSATVGTSDGGTSGDATTETSTTDDSDTGVPANGYGDCANNSVKEACLDDELCLVDGSFSVCRQPCEAAADCPAAPATGTAVPACDSAVFGCFLDCNGADIVCPDGMLCHYNPSVSLLTCAWEVDP